LYGRPGKRPEMGKIDVLELWPYVVYLRHLHGVMLLRVDRLLEATRYGTFLRGIKPLELRKIDVVD
jgi:hypothetical protein